MDKRILIVGQHFYPENFRINDIATGFIEKGYKVDVLCGIPNYPSGSFYKGYGYFKKRKESYNGADVYRCGEIPRGNNSSLRIFLNYIWYPLTSMLNIPRVLFKKYHKIFIYQTSPVMMGWAGLFLGRVKRVERTVYVLDIWPENLFTVLDVQNKFLRKIAFAYSRYLYRKPEKLIVLSEQCKDYMKSYLKESQQVEVIHQYCEDFYTEKKSDEQLVLRYKDSFNIVFTGNLSPAQSLPTAISAVEILKNEGIENFKLIVVGDGMSRGELEAEVESRGLCEFIDFVGSFDALDMPKFFDIADTMIATMADIDNFDLTIPAKISSYIAAGKPLCVAMNGAAADLIHEIGCGVCSPSGDEKALADNLKYLINLDKEQILEMGEKASDYHKKVGCREKVLDKIIEYLER